jgi:NADPH-dependent glutamate synthase beta subunit-like oxidoreductase/coenzyme F420-reducing hydrogenase delta subunit
VHTDVPGYVGLIARGKYQEAYDLIRAVNPFPSVCGLICHHPCEKECRRNDVDEPLAVRDLKRFVSEVMLNRAPSAPVQLAPPTGKKVAVIGAGPGGLAAALELAKMGHKVTVIDKSSVAGGLLAAAIPKYRLPREAIERDIAGILAAGIALKTNCEVGKVVTFNEVMQGFDAVLLCVGLSLSRGLPIPGADAPGVLMALPFLAAVNFEGRAAIGKNVIVIGGGNVAVDVARSARRLGAPYVKMVCLESPEEVPAWPWEVKEAQEEAIETIHRRGPRRVIIENGRVAGLEMKEVRYVFDSSGKFNPAYYEDSLSTVKGDTVIFAIGQAADLSFLKGTGVNVDERGRLIFNKATYQTSEPGVFATGEVVTGPGSAIEAVAHGRRAAEFIGRHLAGEKIEVAAPAEPKKIEKFPTEYVPKIRRTERAKMPAVAGDVRITSFQQFELGFTEEAAVREARRCLNCGTGPVPDKDKCAACLLCLRLCPFGVPTIDQVANMPSALCQTCGLCAVDCPRAAIEMRGYPRDWLQQEARSALAAGRTDSEPIIIAFTCTFNRVYPDSRVVSLLPRGVKEIPVSCAGRVGAIDVLKTLEMGADGVYVVACNDRACKFEGADEVARKRVYRVKEILKQIGLEGRADFFHAMTPGPERYVQVANEMLKRVKELGPMPKKAVTV